MYIQSPTFETVTALIQGYDLATSGGLLVGFREWLEMEAGEVSSLAWSALALSVVRKGREHDATKEIEGVFELLERYLIIRNARQDALQQLFVKYAAWRRKRSNT
jgi:hypothetical protein